MTFARPKKKKAATSRTKRKQDTEIARCPEFVCIEKPDGSRIVEVSTEVEDAMWRAAMRITDAGSQWNERLRLARTLLRLAEHAAGHKAESADLLDALSETLGQMVLDVLQTPNRLVPVSAERKAALKLQFPNRNPADLATSIKETMKSAEVGAETLGSSIGNAVLAIARWKIRPNDWKREYAIQFEARQVFRETLERPTKAEIRSRLEADGDVIKGKNSNSTWQKAFRLAGLENLPER